VFDCKIVLTIRKIKGYDMTKIQIFSSIKLRHDFFNMLV